MSRHPCPAPNCPHTVPYDKFACHDHWFSIPKPLRDEIWAAFRDKPRGERHLVAIKAATDFLEQDARD